MGKELGGLSLGERAAPVMEHFKTNAERSLCFSPFSLKVKIFFRFPSVAKKKNSHRSPVKAKQHNTNSQKVGVPVRAAASLQDSAGIVRASPPEKETEGARGHGRRSSFFLALI